MDRKFCALLGLLCLLATPIPALSAPADDARKLVSQLNPLDLLLGPLIDNAIASGNEALRQRLEQLRSIIEESLYNLNRIIADSTLAINADAEGRINQLSLQVSNNLELLNAIASGQVREFNADTEQRIDQIKNATNNLVQSLPVPAQPLPNVPPKGFALVRPATGTATLFITGAGLFKGGSAPRAYLLRGDGSDSHWFSHNGTELEVKAASMGLMQVEIPAALFPTEGHAQHTLELKLREGNVLSGSVEPTFPLLMCSKMPQYSAQVTLEPMGQTWTTRVWDYPTYTDLGRKEVYIDDGGSNRRKEVCANEADTGEWKADPNAGTYEGTPTYGLQIAELKEHVGATLLNNPRNGCVLLYAGRDNSGGGFAFARGLRVHQRKLAQGSCGTAIVGAIVNLKSGSNSIPTNPQEVLGKCLATTEGASVSPALRTNLVITEDEKKLADQANLVARVPARLLRGVVTASMDQFGLIKIDVTPECGTQSVSYGSN